MIVSINDTKPIIRIALAILGLPGSAPLPPLKAVFSVFKSSPLLKSKCSLSMFTLICAEIAPIKIRKSINKFTCDWVTSEVLKPKNTQMGVKIRNEGRVDLSTVFSNIVLILDLKWLTVY